MVFLCTYLSESMRRNANSDLWSDDLLLTSEHGEFFASPRVARDRAARPLTRGGQDAPHECVHQDTFKRVFRATEM